MISNGGTATLGLYDLKRQIDAFGGVDYFRPNLAGGYLKNARVMLTNGDIVKSTIDGNTNNPNVSMTGWLNIGNTGVVESIADLLSIQNPSDGCRVFVKSIQKWYTYKINLTTPENSVTIVGKWEMDIQDAYYASWFAQPNVILDQSDSLQAGWDYATLKKSNFVFDRIFYVSQKNHTYPDGLVRKIGLQVPNNSTTYFTDNAAIKLIPNAEPLGYVLNFYLAENFKIYDPVVFGDVDEHLATTDESNHCYNIVNCKNGYIHKPKAFNAWGDGIYIGTEYASLTNKQCENVTVFEPYVKHCGRAGMSVSSGIGVKIYSPTFHDIFRTYPKVGINIEGEGVGACKPVLNDINVYGTVTVSNCDIAASVYIFDSLVGDISVNVGDIVAKNCSVPVVTQLFSNNSGSVTLGNIYATAWKVAVLRNNWSQINCQLNIGDIYSINANCNGTTERYSSIISIDIDAESQPVLNIGNVSIGNIYISDTATTKVMHPLYFKDNTAAVDGARKLDNISIGNVYGNTLNTAFYVDGHVTANFKFNLEYVSAYYLPPSRPYLYSKLKSVAKGFDPFTLTLSSSYKTALTVQKYATGTTPLRVILSSGSALNPLALGVNSGIETTVSGSSISIEWSGNNAFITSEVGTWNSY